MATSRLKIWTSGELLTASDHNAEHDIHLSGPYDCNGQQLIFDADTDTYLNTATDDRLDFYFQNTDLFRIDGATASVVNGLDIAMAATGSAPTLTARGNDTNIGVNVVGKGAGNLESDGDEVHGKYRSEAWYGR